MTPAAAPASDTTFVVILGASEYPRDVRLSNPSFRQTAEAIKHYFESPDGFGVPSDNLLWLFDAPDAPSDLDGRLREFLSAAAQRPEPHRPRDLIVYYVGHGFFDDQKAYFLALQNMRPDAPDSNYRFRALQRTIRMEARHARKYVILDACFSGAANREWMSPNVEAKLVIDELAADAKDDLPDRGTALLCAASRDNPARAPTGADHTMFSGALLEVLQNPRECGLRLSLRQIGDLAYDLIRQRHAGDAVHPEVHAPDQDRGDISRIPLFPVGARAKGSGDELVQDALNRMVFASEAAIQCIVVSPERDLGEDDVPLTQHVRRAWELSGTKISAAANQYRTGRNLTLVPSADDVEGAFVLAELPVQRAFDSEASLTNAVEALCRAELAIFDLTGFQAGVLFLLGVRAVARRGVTLASIGGDYTVGGQLMVPFNLQLLNLAAHSAKQEKEGKGLRPWELLGDKIQNGYRELADLAHYLDLPAYESVRQLGVESSAYRPIQYSEKVLVLCPFSPEYTERNWKRFLEAELPGKLMQRLEKLGKAGPEPPRLERLLDLKTPRLVAQTLFESIRLIDMCVIDWTNLRANVMFEAGVRLATNALGAVHIVESVEGTPKWPSDAPPHAANMRTLFSPIGYRCKVGDTAAYREMITRFETSLAANQEGHPGLVYAAVGRSLDRRSHPAAVSVVDELTRAANILESDDQESTGISPVLYHDINKELVAEAREAAAERRLAAWLFMSRRYSAEEIVSDKRRLHQFELLSVQARRWARQERRPDLLSEIKEKQEAVKLAQQQQMGR